MRVLTAILISLSSAAAIAGTPPPQPVSEPGMLGLLAAAGVAALLVKGRRRK
jgi:hypothetical protein